MAEIFDLDPIDANNTARWPEGMFGGAINNSARALEGMLARHARDHDGSRAASGSSNAFAVTSSRSIPALSDNLTMVFTGNHTISGAATLNLNGIGAKSIKRFNGTDLTAGDIVSGQPCWVIYKTSGDQWFLVSNPAVLFANLHADFNENGAPGTPAADTMRLSAFDEGGQTNFRFTRPDGSTGKIRPGTQAEMEAASANDVFISPGRQHFHPLMPKGWALFNGAGSVSGLATAGNVSGVSYLGTGTYRASFNPAFSSLNYGVIGWARGTSAAQVDFVVSAADTGSDSKTTGQIDVRACNASGSVPADSSEIFLVFFGDL